VKSNLVHAHVTVQFNGITPERLYKASVDGEEHACAIGQPKRVKAVCSPPVVDTIPADSFD
jgi:hypothetical protein